MAITKIQSESLNLADDFTFTGTITGAGGGKLLQVTHSTITSYRVTTSSSMVDANLNGSITTSATNSKILVLYNFALGLQGYNDQEALLHLRSSIDSYTSFLTRGEGRDRGANGNENRAFSAGLQYLHSPSQPSGTTIGYKLYWSMPASNGGNISIGDFGAYTGITLMEIAS
jgi:hypothetical protein